MKRRLIALILALAALLGLTGCTDWEDARDPLGALSDYYGMQNEEPEESLQSFVLPCASKESADPITCSDGAQVTLGALLYEPLYQLDERFEAQNVLAQSQSYDPLTMTYTITLRRDVSFSDGTPLTAQDVADTLNRALLSARYGARLQDVDSIEAAGSTVRIQLTVDCRSFISLLDIPIVKSGTEGASFPIGTGPYCFSNESRTLVPNNNWWQDTPRPFPEIQLRSYKSSDAMSYAFSARDVHLLFRDLTSTEAGVLPSGGDYTDADTTVMQFIGFYTGGLFGDATLRCAVSQAINRSSLINAYLLGHGTAAEFPVNPASALYPGGGDASAGTAAYTAALETAGLMTSGQTRTAVMIVNEENSFRVAAAQEIAQTLSRGGLVVEVSALPWDAYKEALQSGHFDMYYGECRLTANWDVSALVSTGGTMNYGLYSSPRMDAQLAACAAADDDKRTAAFARLGQLWQSDMPLAVVCFKKQSLLLPSGAVSGASPTAADPFYGLENWVVKWAEPEK